MNKFWIMLSHTYMTKLKTKSFIITSIIMLVGVLLLGNMGRIIDLFSGGDKGKKIAVVDVTTGVYQPFQQQLKTMNKNIHIEKVNQSEKELQKEIKDEKYEGYLILSTDANKMPSAVYKAITITDTSTANTLQEALQSVKTIMAASTLNLTSEKLALLNSPISFHKVSLGDNAKSEKELAQARGLVYILLFAIYFAVLFYANMVGMEIATEKSSRVMEILISSASPTMQMFAKILGVALLGLTQMAALLGGGYFTIKQNLQTMTGGFFETFGFSNTPISTIIYAVIFFLLGYLLFATLAAFLGSLVSRTEDAGQMMMPMTFIIMIGFFIAMFGLNNPDSGFVTVTSFIPFFTPMIMFMRVGMLDLPTWEGILGVIILIITIVILGTIGARIYRGGVLLYGKSNSLKNIKKALQLTKNQ
jgi:ABC-2 type transport system permease protein